MNVSSGFCPVAIYTWPLVLVSGTGVPWSSKVKDVANIIPTSKYGTFFLMLLPFPNAKTSLSIPRPSKVCS